MSDWLAQAATCLQPLYDLLGQRVLQSLVLHIDDTYLPVLEEGLGKTRRGCVWVYVGDHTQPYHFYVYQPQRNQESLRTLLAGWHGYLQADADKRCGYQRHNTRRPKRVVTLRRAIDPFRGLQ